ncbi:MAG: hypothetical protein CMO34_02070 [Verrucomicrobia bacterium]|nr:hypothetical protein [Verrucomicrobiota bacterium]|tara:strand:+ start:568 stop:1074 length:507 start_codon:yes stop_codon:yes gene_type:complete
MKNISKIIGLFLIALTFFAATPEADCDKKALKKAGIAALKPFYYSSAKITEINYQYKTIKKEIEVPLFKGEKYRLVFNRSALPLNVDIEIHDKDMEHRSAGHKPLFSSKGSEEDILSFEPKKSRTLYVNYIIPKGKRDTKVGCMAFVLGYQLTFIKDEDEEKKEESQE